MDTLNVSTAAIKVQSSSPVPYLVLVTFLTFNLLVCAEVIGLFGIAANILNIENFRRQGFHDNANITLTALVISDIGALVSQQACNMIINPWIQEYETFMVKSQLFIPANYVHEYFIRVSGVITSFAAFERCLCVVLPLKVKGIVTKRVALCVNLMIFVVLTLYLFPPFDVFYTEPRYLPNLNKYILAMVIKGNRNSYFNVYYFIADMFLPYATFLALIGFNVIIIAKLKSKSKWRLSTSGKQVSTTRLSYKERRAVFMLVNISVIFIVCLIPHSGLSTALGIVRSLSVDGSNFDIYKLCYSFTMLLETLNCSVSIYVYYRMSSKYRTTFHEIISPCKRLGLK
ncbi:neuropeptides capa receptor [Biomphalaria glabrata]|nr:neuropeptides capa receptor-like [Biomphalaria glabrata]